MKRILVAYDGSGAAERAFNFAVELARAFRAEVVMLAVARPAEPATMVETTALLDSATEHYEADFQKFRKSAESGGVTFSSMIAVGHPAEQIVHQAGEQKCDHIIMGHRGKSVVERWMLGSVSKRVLSYASCSVTIVR